MGNFVVAEHNKSDEALKIESIISWIVIAILFITSIIYAGIRGYYAYNHNPALVTTFVPASSIPFPWVTFCRDGAVPLEPYECVFENKGAVVSDCMKTATYQTFLIEGSNHDCWRFNSDSSLKIQSKDNEVAILLKLNVSKYLPGQERILGGLVIIHPQNTSPIMKKGTAFLVEAGVITEVWLQYNQLIMLNGTTVPSYDCITSQVGVDASIDPTLSYTIDVDFVFTDIGSYNSVQYYAYTPDNWIGEVGGFVCLFTFLHHAFMFIVSIVVNRWKPKAHFTQMKD